MKVIFLDIDGVFNHILANFVEGTYVHRGYKPPHRQTENGLSLQMLPEKVFMLNCIIDRHPEIRVVLSSAGRINPRWREEMRANGFLFEFLDRTPSFGSHQYDTRPRGSEIRAWMDKWNAEHPEDPVARFAIVDDSSDMLDEHMAHFFRTSCYEGLTPAIANMIEYHLTYEER